MKVLESFVIWMANVLLVFKRAHLGTYFCLSVYMYVCEFFLYTKEVEGGKGSRVSCRTLLALFSDLISREVHEISISIEFPISTEIGLVASLSSQNRQQFTYYATGTSKSWSHASREALFNSHVNIFFLRLNNIKVKTASDRNATPATALKVFEPH